MRKNCVMNTLLFRGVMLLVFLLGVEVGGVAQEDNQDVTVGDVSNTNCANQARGESVMGHPTLKLTRIDSGILGELNNYQANCAFGDIKVICKENEQNLAIYVDDTPSFPTVSYNQKRRESPTPFAEEPSESEGA